MQLDTRIWRDQDLKGGEGQQAIYTSYFQSYRRVLIDGQMILRLAMLYA